MDDAHLKAKAEQLHLQAEFRHNKIYAHIKVYGGRDQWLTRERAFDAQIEQDARNGIEFVEAALKLFPNEPRYLNTYACLLIDGLGEKNLALAVLERAQALAPDDIQLKQNIRSLQKPAQGCLILCSTSIFAGIGYIVGRLCYS
ncbi:MAG: hypothetical protein QOD80_2117 [Verrucomicrobiota bacterium]|jgi:hypothetical protein